MPVDIAKWRELIKQVVSVIADEHYQRRVWFGQGPEVGSPDETFCQFFGDAAIEEFLQRLDTGWTSAQLEAARHLVNLMNRLAEQTPQHIKPNDIIDDPRWAEIRKAAAELDELLR